MPRPTLKLMMMMAAMICCLRSQSI